jgi:hypothetical protein
MNPISRESMPRCAGSKRRSWLAGAKLQPVDHAAGHAPPVQERQRQRRNPFGFGGFRLHAGEIGTKMKPLTPSLKEQDVRGVSVVVTLSRVSAGYAAGDEDDATAAM